jgi:hypothetical protein
MSAAGRAISKALDIPGDWEVGKYTIKHLPTRQFFWIANGAFFFDGYDGQDTPKCLGLVERHWLYRKARKLVAALVVTKFALSEKGAA